MILTKKEILKEIKAKNIVIKGFKNNNLGPASYDLTLDNKFRLFKSTNIVIDDKVDYKKYTKLITSNTITLNPGELILGITKEQVKMNGELCAFLSGRTKFARLGLSVYITANFVNPDTNNKQVLEIKNESNNIFKLKVGTKICQIIFCRTEGVAKNNGKFVKQVTF